jgi:hypothetical protein
MNWNIGHILVIRDRSLGAIDGVSAPDPAEYTIYGPRSEPLTDSSKAIPLETLIERLDESSERLKDAFQTISPGKLDELYESNKGKSLDDYLLHYVVVHEAIHLGQLEILRELALA